MRGRTVTIGGRAALAALVLLAPDVASSQRVPVRQLSRPEASSRAGFTKLVGLRELADGRVVIVDELDRLVRVLDAGLEEVTQVGRQGSGPGEYMSPGRVFGLAGDSFAIQDQHNARMLVITGAGAVSGFLDRFGAPPGTSVPDVKLPPMAADGRGCFYTQAAPGVAASTGSRVRLSASAPVLRWCGRDARRDTVALVGVPESEQTGAAAGRGLVVRMPSGPFSTRAQWAVAHDGTLAIVTPDPYRVEIVRPDGTRRQGPAVSYDRVRVTEALKAEWRKDASAPVMGIMVGRDGSRSARAITPQPREPAEWPAYLPPFLYDAVKAAPDGRFWVQRTTAAGGPGAYDVFDSSGVLVERVAVPRGSRLLGFGRNGVYLVTRDELDLENVARYR